MFGRAAAGSASIEKHHRLVRHEGNHPHAGEGDGGANHIPAEDRPEHVAAPLQRAPAVGEQLNDREQDHARGDVEIVEQNAEQDHASGHAEHAGEKRSKNDGGS
jgi:hypothetical protein